MAGWCWNFNHVTTYSGSGSWPYGFGGSVSRGNTIGNSFKSNNVGEYFYDNVVCDRVESCTFGDNFQFNRIETQLTSYDFTVKVGRPTAVSGWTSVGDVTDDTYNNVSLSGGAGDQAATANIIVSGNAIQSVTFTNNGKNYLVGDILTFPGSVIGSATTTIQVTISSVMEPVVYRVINSSILSDVSGAPRLCFVDDGFIFIDPTDPAA